MDPIPPAQRIVFIAGGTGYLGMPLIAALVARGHRVRTLVRESSRQRVAAALPAGVECIVGDTLEADSFAESVRGADTFVQMAGVPHPSPAKAGEFLSFDLVSATAGLDAACRSAVAHFVYVSVSQFPGERIPAMRAYVESRALAEARIRERVAGGTLGATFVRPWYVLGPGHRWPLLLAPLMALAAWVPGWKTRIGKMGLVSRDAFVSAMVHAIEHPAATLKVIDVDGIRAIGSRTAR